jgi:hypothetical protein
VVVSKMVNLFVIEEENEEDCEDCDCEDCEDEE